MSSPIVLCFYVFRLSVCANEIHIDVSFDHVFVSLRRHAHAASIFLCRSLARALAILLGVSSLSLSLSRDFFFGLLASIQHNVRLWAMNRIVHPSSALLHAQTAPFRLRH
jgi:hypothetical protein